MALFPCPDCSRELSPLAPSCPNCGRTFSSCPYCKRALPHEDDRRCPWCGNDPNATPTKPQPRPLDRKTLIGWAIVALIVIITLGMCSPEKERKEQGASKPAPSKPVAVVSNSAWDGSVYQVERWLKDNLKDPGSFEAIEWSPVVEVPAGSDLPHRFIVRCKYRAKNSFGGYVVEQKLFYLDAAGQVVSSRDIR